MMHTLLAATALLCAAGLAAAAAPTHGMHGMALFGGRDGVYAAHLPMFHAPHDYQVLLRVRLADKGQDAALRKRLGGGSALWTLAPEKFAIDRLAPGAADPLRDFHADLVLGHFEQGGKTQYAQARVVVDKVLLFRQLLPQAGAGATSTYFQVGSGTRRFLVKQVDRRPDFDHIVAVVVPPRTPAGPISVARAALAETPAALLQRALPGARVAGTVYYATGDLK